jgi:hypothetical protein
MVKAVVTACTIVVYPYMKMGIRRLSKREKERIIGYLALRLKGYTKFLQYLD